jgi:Domain of unknown function (DUF5666)
MKLSSLSLSLSLSLRRLLPACGLAVCIMLVAACGGVGTDGTGASSDTVAIGVVTGIGDRTVTVNGIAYERESAAVSDAFGQAMRADELRLGMWLEVSGTVDEAAGTARAQSIRVRPAARGSVTAVDGGGLALTLLQSTVRYDAAATVVDGVDAASALAVGDLVEVHGPLGAATGTVEASRIERLAAGPSAIKPVELRGRVGNLDSAARTLTVGRQPVRYDSAALTLRQALADGQLVRVSALAAPVIGQPWRVERMTSDQALPDNLGFVYAEGVTTDWAAGPTFTLEGVPVDARGANGRGAVTADGQRVAVIGSLVSGTLNAKSVARSVAGRSVVFVLGAAVTDFQSIADFRVRGVTVNASAAVFVSGVATDLANGRKVRVTGNVSGRRLIASKVEFLP